MSKYTISFGLSLALASVMNALLVVAKEKSPAVMTALQRLTGHHWISHAAIVIAVFVGFGLGIAQVNGGKSPQFGASRLIGVVISGIVIGVITILGFYLIEV